MRDRLPLAQTDQLIGVKTNSNENKAADPVNLTRRRRVPGKSNMAIIHSGQDWLDKYPEELKLYLETMLVRGMSDTPHS
jgi:hypothetical protein